MSKNWRYILNIKNIKTESISIFSLLFDNINTIIQTKINNRKIASYICNMISKNNIEYNSILSIIELYIILNNTIVDDYKILNKLIRNYNKKILSRDYIKQLYKLSEILDGEQKIFIDNIIKINYTNKISHTDDTKQNIIVEYISKLNYNLITKMSKCYFVLYLENNMIQESNTNINTTKINYNNYYKINNILLKQKDRYKLCTEYNKFTSIFLSDFTKLLILRHQYAKLSNYDHYGHYILNKSNNQFDSIEIILKNIINRLNEDIMYMMKLISNELELKKITHNDICYWIYNQILNNNNNYNVTNIIHMFIKYSKKYFDITITKINNNNIWNDTSLSFSVHRKELLIGYLFIDLKSNNIQKHNIIVLNDYHHFHVDNELYSKIPHIVLIINHSSYSKKELNSNEAVNLFKEFGYIVHHFLHKSKYGLNNVDFEFHNFMPYLMEQIFWHNNKQTKYDKLYKLYNVYKLCIDSLFDILIHTSEPFIDMCKDLAKDEDNLDYHMNKLYFKLYDKIVDNFSDYFIYQNNNIDFDLIQKLINGDSCIIYTNILNDIISYNIYNIIDENNKNKDKLINALISSNDMFKNIIINSFGDNNLMCIDNYINNIKNYDKKTQESYEDLEIISSESPNIGDIKIKNKMIKLDL